MDKFLIFFILLITPYLVYNIESNRRNKLSNKKFSDKKIESQQQQQQIDRIQLRDLPTDVQFDTDSTNSDMNSDFFEDDDDDDDDYEICSDYDEFVGDDEEDIININSNTKIK